MTTKLISPDPLRPDEQAEAEQLDQLITQRQQGQVTAEPLVPPSAETLLVDTLVQMAADTTPTPAFVATLEEQLRKPAAEQPVHHRPARQRFFLPVRRVAVAAAIVLAVGSALYLAPAARATLWDWFYGFGLIAEEQVTTQAVPLTTPAMPAVAPTALTLAAIQEQAPFTFRPPTWLPLGLRFTGGFVMPDTDGTVITLAYHLTDPPADGYPLDAPLLFAVISDGRIPNRPLVADGYQERVQIGQRSGVYTHGNWRETDDTTGAPSATATLVWDSTLDAAWLTWQADDLNYLLFAQGLQVDAADLAVVALSMQ